MKTSDGFTLFRMTWLDQIYDDPELTPVARDVAFRISRMFNRKRFQDKGICSAWPSYETLAKDAGCSSKTVQRAILKLKERSHLVTKGNGGRHCTLTYFAVLTGHKSTSFEPLENDVKGGHHSPPFEESSHLSPEKVDIPVPKGGQMSAEKVDTRVLQTSLNKTFDKISDKSAHHENQFAASPARSPIGVIVLSILADGPTHHQPVPPMLRGKEDQYPDLVNDHRAATGWPTLHQQCQEPSRRSPELEKMAFEMVDVAADSELWAAWKSEYRSRGWPMPVPLDGLACFPEGGPSMLDAFIARIKQAKIDKAVMHSQNVVRLGSAR